MKKKWQRSRGRKYVQRSAHGSCDQLCPVPDVPSPLGHTAGPPKACQATVECGFCVVIGLVEMVVVVGDSVVECSKFNLAPKRVMAGKDRDTEIQDGPRLANHRMRLELFSGVTSVSPPFNLMHGAFGTKKFARIAAFPLHSNQQFLTRPQFSS